MLGCVGSRCWTMTNAMPLSAGMAERSSVRAVTPPAEAPIPTIGKRDDSEMSAFIGGLDPLDQYVRSVTGYVVKRMESAAQRGQAFAASPVQLRIAGELENEPRCRGSDPARA